MPKANNSELPKVYFIVSNQTNLDEKINYLLCEQSGISNLQKELTFQYRYNNRENFTIIISNSSCIY